MRAVIAAAVFAICVGPASVAAQESPVYRALELEDASRWEEAAVLYRASLSGPDSVQALFGIERALLTLNRGEELSTLLAELVRQRPADELARAMYVRTLLRLERRDAAREFVREWITRRPADSEAYQQLYSIGPLAPEEARTIWRRLRGAQESPATATIIQQLIEHVFSVGAWSLAAEILEERYTRAPSAELAEQLALAAARAGNLQRAHAVASAAGLPAESAVYGWLALYAGDLVPARRLLVRADEADPFAVLPLAALARTRSERSPAFGEALLLLVRGDSSRAARAFEAAATEMSGAEPLVLALAARLFAAQRDRPSARRLFDVIARDYPRSPEGPEAVLEQARSLATSGDREAAAARLEHLILSYPESALVPAARRELDSVRGATPPVR